MERMSLFALSWVLYLVGIALIGGGYLGLVSPGVSWIGWLIGMAGWGMQFLPGYRKSPPLLESGTEPPNP